MRLVSLCSGGGQGMAAILETCLERIHARRTEGCARRHVVARTRERHTLEASVTDAVEVLVLCFATSVNG